jgi:hypothetical protein
MAREDGFFDDLARGLASGTLSRGKALRLMGAALVGGALGSVGIGEAAAAPIGCKADGKKCKNGNQCCSRNCEGGTCAAACVPNGGTCAIGSQCCSGNCSGDICVSCPSGQELCSNGSCASTSCSQGNIFDPFTCSCVPQCIPDCPSGCFCENRGDGSGQVCGECFTGPCFTPLGGVGSCAECTGDTPVCVRREPGILICVRPCTAAAG